MQNVIHPLTTRQEPIVYQAEQGGMQLSYNCWQIAMEADAFWLFDCIISQQRSGLFEFNTIQSWIFGNYIPVGWSAICEIGDETVLSLREISTKEFPLRSIHFVVYNNFCQLLSELTD